MGALSYCLLALSCPQTETTQLLSGHLNRLLTMRRINYSKTRLARVRQMEKFMPTEVRIQPVEAFILFNEQESQVEKAVEMLEERRVSTYFWRRDIAIGESWSDIETVQLEEAKTVVVFLGAAGWGPTQQQIAESAVKLNKQIIPC